MPAGRERFTRRRFGAIVASMLLGPIIAACGGGDDKSDDKQASSTSPVAKTPKKVTFMAGFQAQANLPFVGAYVAAEKGFFKEQALEVDIRHAQSGEHLQLMLAGEVQFSTANGSQVLLRNGDSLPVVSIGLIGQRSEQGYAVLTTSGIKTVKDWAGKTFGYKGSVPAEFLAIARANGLDPASVKQVRVGFDPRVLSEGQVDILAVFFSNEPDTLERLGFPTRVFDPNEFGLQSLGLTYVASRDYVAKDPDATERFLKAALKGVDYANQNRDEALEIVLKYAPQQDRNHQRFMLNTELDRSITDLTKANGVGWQTREQWQANHDMLFDYQVLKQRLEISQVYTDEFLKKIYKGGKLIWP
ncbi:MAG TPA: ABC transporter substrate-binding protein [Dehalococcoidia bacterium]|nr:ABC transporter substrate-binding protein [Dehalococcoidia bacterium]